MSSEQAILQSTQTHLTDATNKSNIFVELFEADKNRLYAYIYAYMMDKAAADDVFQETSVALWKDFEKFELGTNFSKWANGIAFNRVRDYRYAHKKYTLGFSEDFLQEFSDKVATPETFNLSQQEKKWWHLEQCCSMLPAPLQQIYQRFYVNNLNAQELADETGRSIYAIRKAIRKLRRKLYDCVEQKVMESADEL
ncbi:sigma-70 family RNA polymerase sigma factor [Catenovulum agarivorans]|uniref:sigma-70 family RNA polymerase sigma factor n=1 Tax=Catenovulum agarivorans TaxID=1172192 RepID=UPI00031D69E6|nr:sigma-70 family RNA polymerase sigma factor [Catenovulum agarivorans]